MISKIAMLGVNIDSLSSAADKAEEKSITENNKAEKAPNASKFTA